MDLYLVKDQVVTFMATMTNVTSRGRVLLERTSPEVSKAFPLTLEPVDPECEDSKEYCKIIASQATGGLSDQVDFKLARQLKAYFHFSTTSPNSRSDCTLMLNEQEDYENGKQPTIVDLIVRLFSKENVSFHLIVKKMNIQYSCRSATEVDLRLNDPDIGRNYLSFKDMKLPEHPLYSVKGLHTSQCRMTLTVRLNYGALAKVPLQTLGSKGERLLNEGIGSDLVVVAENGAEVKGHKCALMVSSDAFRKMFESKMKEDKTSRLELPDMSEAGVRAFLGFIYTCDLRAASGSCDIALELFRAGDKYRMSSLKSRVKVLICSKPAEWFSVDMAIRWSLLAQNMKGNEEILKKTMEVLKWYSKNSLAELLASEEYQELFQNQVGKELFGHFLKLD